MLKMCVSLFLLFLAAGTVLTFVFFWFSRIFRKELPVDTVIDCNTAMHMPDGTPGEETGVPHKAVVRCSPDRKFAAGRFEYAGFKDCALFKSVYGSGTDCANGCIGFGSCMTVCPVNAIKLVNGTAVITNACNGCGICLESCPNGLISLVRADEEYFIQCATENARTTSCSAACNGCGQCNPSGYPSAIKAEPHKLAVIDYHSGLKVLRQQVQSCKPQCIKKIPDIKEKGFKFWQQCYRITSVNKQKNR